MKEPKEPLTIVTGAAGMIGSGIIRYFNDLGKESLLLVDDFKKSEKWKNLVGKRFAGIVSRHEIFNWLNGRQDEVKAILHLGACSDTTETDGDYLLENNVRFSIRLAEWALSFDKRFVYASSAATYGDGSQGFSDDEEKLEELRPLNLYGFSKHLIDLWMKRQKVFDRVVALKYFNVFGPNEYHKGKMSSMIFKMAFKARDEGRISLYKSNDPIRFADGEQCRDFIYLPDAVRMTVPFILDPKYERIGGVYNIGRGAPATWNALASALFDALEKSPSICYVEMPPELQKQYQNYTCADMRKFHKIFSSEPAILQTTPLESAIREYVRDYLMRNERW